MSAGIVGGCVEGLAGVGSVMDPSEPAFGLLPVTVLTQWPILWEINYALIIFHLIFFNGVEMQETHVHNTARMFLLITGKFVEWSLIILALV